MFYFQRTAERSLSSRPSTWWLHSSSSASRSSARRRLSVVFCRPGFSGLLGSSLIAREKVEDAVAAEGGQVVGLIYLLETVSSPVVMMMLV